MVCVVCYHPSRVTGKSWPNSESASRVHRHPWPGRRALVVFSCICKLLLYFRGKRLALCVLAATSFVAVFSWVIWPGEGWAGGRGSRARGAGIAVQSCWRLAPAGCWLLQTRMWLCSALAMDQLNCTRQTLAFYIFTRTSFRKGNSDNLV